MEIINIVKGLTEEERLYVEQLVSDFTDEEKTMFLIKYKVMRRNPYTYAVLSMVGLFGFAGFHRFYSKQYLKGILYFCTIGFLWVGTLIDTMSFMKQTAEANIAIAERLAFQIRDQSYKLNNANKPRLQ